MYQNTMTFVKGVGIGMLALAALSMLGSRSNAGSGRAFDARFPVVPPPPQDAFQHEQSHACGHTFCGQRPA